MKTRNLSPLRFVFSCTFVALALVVAVWNMNGQSVNRVTPTPDTWSAGTSLSANLVRAVGVYFPANGLFYAMGGRSLDTAGNDSIHPFEYNPAANTWTTKGAFLPDTAMNNMACGVLTVGGTPQIYCVGGSAAGATTASARVFSYNPATDTVTTLTAADNWPGNPGTILPGGFAVLNNKLYIMGGFNINVGMTQQTWQFDPTAGVGARWLQRADYPVQRGYIPAVAINGFIYTAGGPSWDGTTLVDSTDANRYDPNSNTWGHLAPIPRATGETRALALNGQMWVLGGGRTAPNPSMQVDIYNPGTNTWGTGQAFATARRNFAADTDGIRVWLAGGYDSTGTTLLSSMERFLRPLASSAVSRKSHAGMPFDVVLPLSGTPGIEPRSSAGAHTIIVTFPTAVSLTGATVITGTGVVGSATAAGNLVTVNLTGVTNAQRVTVLLNNVNDGATVGDVPITMGYLIGDTNGNGSTNASDVIQTKAQIGATVGLGNFRTDVNASGGISSSDVTIVKANGGTALPP